MKKKFLLCMSLVSMIIAFNACSSSDDNGYTEPTVEVVTNYTLSGTISEGTKGLEGVKISAVVNGTSLNATSNAAGAYSFDMNKAFKEGAECAVTFSKDGYIEQSTKYTMAKENGESKIISVDMSKASTEVVKVSKEGEATEVVIKNDAATQTTAEVVTTIAVPANTVITGVTGDANFSVTPYNPVAEEEKKEETSNNTSSFITLNCQPSGAKFSQPVKLTVQVPSSENYFTGVTCVNGTESVPVTVDKNGYNCSVTHFSDWTFTVSPSRTRSDKTQELTNKVYKNAAITDNAAISYKQGIELVSSELTGDLLKKAKDCINYDFAMHFNDLQNNKASLKVSWNSPGTVNLTATQKYYVYTYTFKTDKGDKKVVINAYDPISSGDINYSFEYDTHSGGNGK